MQPNINVISAARAAQRKWKLLASVSLAQWALESGWGRAAPGNNPFGIKHMAGFPDQLLHTHEYIHGQYVPQDLDFAVFPDIATAFDVHAKLIATAPVYAPAMAALPDLGKFLALMGPHYATAPGYAGSVMDVIRGSNLTQYDLVA